MDTDPDGPEWLHEIKHDGYRMAARPRSQPVFDDPGPVMFEHACKLGCEGIVSKRRGSRYARGRSSNWLKVKNPDAPAVRRERLEEWAG